MIDLCKGPLIAPLSIKSVPPSDLWTVSVNVCSKSYAMYLYVEGQFFPCFLLRDFWDLPEKEPANFNQVLGCLFDTYTPFQNE